MADTSYPSSSPEQPSPDGSHTDIHSFMQLLLVLSALASDKSDPATNWEERIYCEPTQACSPKGLINLRRCLEKEGGEFDIYASLPRFLNADERIRQSMDGIPEPNPTDHGSFIHVEPEARADKETVNTFKTQILDMQTTVALAVRLACGFCGLLSLVFAVILAVVCIRTKKPSTEDNYSSTTIKRTVDSLTSDTYNLPDVKPDGKPPKTRLFVPSPSHEQGSSAQAKFTAVFRKAALRKATIDDSTGTFEGLQNREGGDS
ncbi:uncharacterized protein DEA37_0014052 [Paragonimus westermani]|uniref:Uncharacterized protein n=1 Tax=Paragonimus westermani TaxID=34504 RepID=A0A5J4NG22_9TREM|nr:uncharacterized protein DEA37_0014052 [Paragonimus westermani]